MKHRWDDDPTVVAFETLSRQLELEVPRHGNVARTLMSVQKELRWLGFKFIHAKYRSELNGINWDYLPWPEGWATVRSVR